MQIIDLTDTHKPIYFLCLEDWSSDIREAGDHKSLWYDTMKEKGLRVKLAVDDKGTVGGMIQYIPVEHSIISGENLYFIYCIWVHGHKEGRGNMQKKGLGKALLLAAEEDAKSLGAKGMAAWGISLPVWMKASWFKKYGYKKADKDKLAVLLWKPFEKDAKPPTWIKQKKTPEPVQGRVAVTLFKNGWCPAQNLTYERAKRACTEFGDKVIFREIDTLDRNNLDEWGISDAMFIDDKLFGNGPPPAYEKIRKKIEKRVKKIK